MDKRTDWDNYRLVLEGEIIQAGDECLTDSDLGWQPAGRTVGQAAPSPYYTAHRMYRRPLVAPQQSGATATDLPHMADVASYDDYFPDLEAV